ncbi:MAG: PAS-domain containing protein [Alphaproteobacteria bacterium]|nr:PAS-domain containing protein [Alphaproteobacteria bacterium]
MAKAAELARLKERLALLQEEGSAHAAAAGRAREDAARLALKLAASDERARRLAAILDDLPQPLWQRDAELRLVWCNRTYAAMLEETQERVVERGLELAARIDPEQPRRLAEKARAGGKAATERRHLVVGGDRRTYRFTELPRADGTLTGFAEDISAEEAKERELSRHIAAHGEVLQNINTAIAIYGADRRLILFNRAFARLWGMDENWLAEEPGFAEILEHLRGKRRLPEQANWQSYKKAQLDQFTSVIEAREELLHLPDERTLRVVVTPHPFGGLLFNYEDVTDQLGLERARNTLIAVQRATLDNLYEGVSVFGADGRMRLWNSSFAKIWNLQTHLLDAEPHLSQLLDAIRPLMDDGGNWARMIERVLEAFNEREARTGRIERPDGSVIDYASVPLPDGAMLYTFLDVTDSMRIERALRERNEALQAADQLKSEFIANVSYELRTPLNTIIGFTEIIANEYFGPLNLRQKEYTQGILDSSHHLLLLVNDILDLATIEAGHMQLELDRFDLHALLVSILALTREHSLRRNLTVHFECAPDIGWVEADERRIKQVLYNLMNNALKFTPSNGQISLGARRSGHEVAIWVSDTGIGIPEEEQAQVFERFVKGRNALRQPGAGLGLPLVRSFIEMHGGHVELKSTPEQGTTVTCYLPAEQRRPLAAIH